MAVDKIVFRGGRVTISEAARLAEISGGSQVDIEERRPWNDVIIVPRIINGRADDESPRTGSIRV